MGWRGRGRLIRQVNCDQLIGVIREQQGAQGRHALLDEPPDNFSYLRAIYCAGQIPRHFVERLGTFLPSQSDGRLLPQPPGELAGDQPHRKHHTERDEVLGIIHRERKSWRHEKYIEQGHAEKSRHHRRPPAETHRDQDHGQQEQHDNVGQVEDAQ